MASENLLTIGAVAILATAAGFVTFLIIMALVKLRWRADQRAQHREIINDGKTHAKRRLVSEAERVEDEIQLLTEQLDTDIHERREDLKMTEEDLDSREPSLQKFESRITKAATEAEARKQKVENRKAVYQAKLAELQALQRDSVSSLEATSGESADKTRQTQANNLVETRQIESQKTLRFMEDELGTASKRLAARALARSMARYAPEFYWPKMINSVELDPRLVERVEAAPSLLSDLKEMAEIDIELLADSQPQTPILKLTGGAGINREATRMTLNEILPKGHGAWSRVHETYQKHRKTLENQAIKLGRQAVRECGLNYIHLEIQKLVGYLYWRTSYRQNQWHHTVEVAKLAGIIANEIGVDPDEAKRCGLLHDIGKALDYKIEGSHAVISGDYADRFGEDRRICDTVMSHHADLIVETPLAYVLRAADTLSGARPGARVNLEEGYQMRLSGINDAVRSFPGVVSVAIMNGAREVHVEVNNKKVSDSDLARLAKEMAAKIMEDVAFPGEIKILLSRRFESNAVA